MHIINAKLHNYLIIAQLLLYCFENVLQKSFFRNLSGVDKAKDNDLKEWDRITFILRPHLDFRYNTDNECWDVIEENGLVKKG